MSAALDLRSKEEKDAELDKRIEALRKKNEALIKRYQEIEEDRKKAEQEGIAVTALRRARPPEPERRWVDKDLSVTVQEKRLAKDKKPSGTPKPGRGAVPRGLGRAGRSPRGGEQPPETLWEGAVGDGVTPGDRGGRGRRARGRGAAGPGLGGDAGPDRKSKEWEERRRQNIKKMNEEMEKIAEYERNQRDGLHEKNPVRNFLDDPRRSGPFQDADRKEGSRRHVRNWGGPDFDKVKAGMEREKTWQGPVRTPLCLLGGSQDGFGAGFEPGGRGWSCVWPQGRRASAKAGGSLDMTLSMTGRERAEYVRWKEERDQIDRERLARHRKPTGQWRREWDAEKSDSMFKEGSAAAPGSDASGEEEPKRPPPRAPTFGEFLVPPRGQRRRRGRGRAPGAGPRPYSMHDNRWEEKEPPAPAAATPSPQVEEAPSGAPPQPPHSLSPEEDEDQWEDVSEEEEEEEEEEEGGSSTASSIEDEAPRSASPKAQRPPQGAGQAPHVSVPPPGVAPAPERGAGTPPSPFSPLGGRQPVSDWGEEMDLASPRSSLGDSPLPGVPKSRGASGETPGLSPEELAEPPRGAQNPAAPPPQHEARPNAAQEVSEKPEEAATGDGAREPAEAAPGTVEITDFQRDGQAPRRPPAAPPSPGSLPL